MSRRSALALLLFVFPAPASAQGSPFMSGRIAHVGADAYTIVQRWQGNRGAIEVAGSAGSVSIPIETTAYMASASGTNALLIALADVQRPAITAILVPVQSGRPGTPSRQAIERPGGAGLGAVGISATARPDGFAVWWQEASLDQANAMWSTYEARLDGAGHTASPSRALPQVPWPIADVAYVEAGSTFLLLYFASGDPMGTRLCAVRIADAGNSMEHPWWASRQGLIGEARLLVGNGRVRAIYRGGRDGSTLLEADVSAGQWGQEAAEPRSHGRLSGNEIFGARMDRANVLVEHRH